MSVASQIVAHDASCVLRDTRTRSAFLRARVELVGDGTERERLTALAAGLGMADRVTFRGFVSDEELVLAYQRCAVFCMPGTAELQSLATMEAMAAAKPVVAADAMALPHLVHPGRNGWLYQPGDVAGLTMALTDVLSDDPSRARMGEASRELIAAHDIENTVDTFERLYRDVAGETVGQAAIGRGRIGLTHRSSADDLAAVSGARPRPRP